MLHPRSSLEDDHNLYAARREDKRNQLASETNAYRLQVPL